MIDQLDSGTPSSPSHRDLNISIHDILSRNRTVLVNFSINILLEYYSVINRFSLIISNFDRPTIIKWLRKFRELLSLRSRLVDTYEVICGKLCVRLTIKSQVQRT